LDTSKFIDTSRAREEPIMRLQLALNVENLDEAVAFYEKLFATPAHKRKPGYANFAIAEPPLKLVLFEQPGAPERLNHLGVEVFEDGDVAAATERLKAAGLADLVEDETTCCYAKSDKVWANDPQGMRWEFYRVLADSETFGAPTPEPEASPTPKGGCC
jgi:predicted enzyme related to lactoylglutathione lyase